MKKELAWRYTSLIIVLAIFGFTLFGLGKPALTAFVVSEEDYLVLVDSELNKELKEKIKVKLNQYLSKMK